MGVWDAKTIVEIRSTGLGTNGGGFGNLTPGVSVDYSQQDAPQLSLVDVASNAAGTQLTSAAGGFTQAMEGNVIHVHNGFGVDFVQIVSGGYIDTHTVNVSPAMAPNQAGVSANVGGAYKLGGSFMRDLTFWQRLHTNNIVWFGPGTHGPLLTGIGWPAGAGPNLGRMIGYHVTRGDNPVGLNRPLIDCAGQSILPNNWKTVENLRLTGTGADVLSAGGLCMCFNVKATNTGVIAGRNAFNFSGGVGSIVIACEGQTDGSGFSTAFILSERCKVAHSFAHDSPFGFTTSSIGTGCDFCVADTCGTGFSKIEWHRNCLAYNCTYGYYLPNAAVWSALLNCIADACTFDFYSDQAVDQEGAFTFFNCLNGVTHYTHIKDWYGNIIGDPGLKNPAADDFRVDSFDRNVFERALELSQFTGAKV